MTSLFRVKRGLKPNMRSFRTSVIHHRGYATDWKPVDLEFDAFIPPNGNKTDEPLVIVHGFFGSKRNWQSLSKAFMRDLDRPVYALDLRNQGSSVHVKPMHYSAMASDVLHFCQRNSLKNISLMGHSMGGKVVMTCALSTELPFELISRLVAVDIAPAKGELSPEFQQYVIAMQEITERKVKSRKEAEEILTNYEKDPSVRAFLLTNIIPPSPGGESHITFRLPLDILKGAIPEIGSFPWEGGERIWEGKTLFIKGTQSSYINRHNKNTAAQFFPKMEMHELDAGHWVHAEQPTAFKKLVLDFIKTDP